MKIEALHWLCVIPFSHLDLINWCSLFFRIAAARFVIQLSEAEARDGRSTTTRRRSRWKKKTGRAIKFGNVGNCFVRNRLAKKNHNLFGWYLIATPSIGSTYLIKYITYTRVAFICVNISNASRLAHGNLLCL